MSWTQIIDAFNKFKWSISFIQNNKWDLTVSPLFCSIQVYEAFERCQKYTTSGLMGWSKNHTNVLLFLDKVSQTQFMILTNVMGLSTIHDPHGWPMLCSPSTLFDSLEWWKATHCIWFDPVINVVHLFQENNVILRIHIH